MHSVTLTNPKCLFSLTIDRFAAVPRNTSSMSILALLVLFLGIGGHTDARKFSTQILHYNVPPPKHNDYPPDPPALTSGHTDARKLSTQILHYNVPPPKHNDYPPDPPALTSGHTDARKFSTQILHYNVPPPKHNDYPPDPPALTSDQTYAKEFSLPTLRYDVPLPKFNAPPEKPPASTDNLIKDGLQEELATISYPLDSWVCNSNNPSHPNCRGNKFSWPELVGKQGKEAKVLVQKENPYIDAVDYAPQDAIVTDNYCCNRVRLIMNCDPGCDYENATVFQVPIVG